MTPRFRLSEAADNDVEDILAWSEANFGLEAHHRYLRLLEAAVAHAAASRGSLLLKPRPELGEGVLSWHISHSVIRGGGQRVRTPRHILYCRWEGDVLAVGRVLHERMDPTQHVDPDTDWA